MFIEEFIEWIKNSAVNKISTRSRKRIHQLQRENKIIGEIVFATIGNSGDERNSKLKKLLWIMQNFSKALQYSPSIQRLESQHEK